MHSDGFKGMENRMSKLKTKHMCVCMQLCVSGDQLHFQVVLQMRHIEILPFPDLALAEMRANLGDMHASTCIYKHAHTHTHVNTNMFLSTVTHLFILADSMSGYIRSFPGDGSCFA